MAETTQTKQYQTRRFVYDGKEIPNVPDDMTIEDVKKHLAVYFPELGNATHTEKAENGVLTITFHKQVTSKGGEHALFLEIAAGLPEIDHAAVSLYRKIGQGPFTVKLLAERAGEIEAAAAFIQEQIHIPQEIVSACAMLPPVSAPVVPIGF
jgi:PRTRC genetic system protein C